jgi:hypothetical protein
MADSQAQSQNRSATEMYYAHPTREIALCFAMQQGQTAVVNVVTEATGAGAGADPRAMRVMKPEL